MSERVARLFDTHAPRLYRLARRLAPSADDALDLVQEAFLRAARAPQAVPGDPALEEAWLVRVLINIRRDQWRREAVRRRHEHDLREESISRDAESAFLARTLVWDALDHLSPRRRAVVVMHELEGLPLSSVASLLGITVITARWHLSRARRELARRLKPQLGETDAQPQTAADGRRSAPSRSASH